MNEARIERQVGKEMADAARRARPKLEELAKDCEMYVEGFSENTYANLDRYLIRIKKGLFNSVKAISETRSLMRNSFEKEIIDTAANLKKAL